MKKGFIVAIDGYSSTGKSTVAKRLASQLGFVYIDTGAMYRMVTLYALREGWIGEGKVNDEALGKALPGLKLEFQHNAVTGKNEAYLNGENVEGEIRGMEVADHVSLIAALPYVREVLVEKQREMGRGARVIMDGRDIGSVVFPDADVKFFLTASPDIRAERRYRELEAKGEHVSREEVAENVRKRDYIDEHRETSPLKRVPDAVLIDNGTMSVEEEVEMMEHIIRSKYESGD